MAYADLTQLKADYLPDAKSESESAAVGRILDNVSAFVDTYCRRPTGYFDPSPPEPTERRFTAEGERYLRLPVHVPDSISTVTLDGVTIDSWYESDRNGWIYADDDRLYEFTEGRTYKVTARWGYAITPKDIQEAVRQTVVRLWETQNGVLGDVTPSGFVIERAMPLFAKEVLDRYRKREFERC